MNNAEDDMDNTGKILEITPLSDLITDHVREKSPGTFERLLQEFLESQIGVIIKDPPPYAALVPTVKSDGNIRVVLQNTPDGKTMIVCCADIDVFRMKFDSPFNATMQGRDVLNMLLKDPDENIAGVIVKSATSNHSLIIWRELAAALLDQEAESKDHAREDQTLSHRKTGNEIINYLSGLFAPLIFIYTAIMGGSLRPGYSHLADTVSELFTAGSPGQSILTTFYLLFGFLLIVFGQGLRIFFAKLGDQQRIGLWGGNLFSFVGFLNLLTATVFPQDPWGGQATFQGEMHMLFSGIITLFSIGYMLLIGTWFKRSGVVGFFWTYTLVTIVLAVLSGIGFVISIDSPIMGLAERAAILVGFQWTFVLAILVLKNDPDALRRSNILEQEPGLGR